MADLNVIEKANLFRDVARIIERINVIERKLSGDQIDSVRIKDAAITNAKVDTLSGNKIIVNTMDADRILASTIDVAVDVGTGTGGAYVRLDGVNNRIVVHDGTTNRIVIGNI